MTIKGGEDFIRRGEQLRRRYPRDIELHEYVEDAVKLLTSVRAKSAASTPVSQPVSHKKRDRRDYQREYMRRWRSG
jgi:hypothetical protein